MGLVLNGNAKKKQTNNNKKKKANKQQQKLTHKKPLEIYILDVRRLLVHGTLLHKKKHVKRNGWKKTEEKRSES